MSVSRANESNEVYGDKMKFRNHYIKPAAIALLLEKIASLILLPSRVSNQIDIV